MQRSLYIGIFFFLFVTLNAQTKFQKTYSRGSYDAFGEAIMNTDSSYYIPTTTSTATRGYDLGINKFNKFGDTIWTRTYGSGGLDYGGPLKKTNDGNFVCMGQTINFGSGNYDAYLVKINPNGDTIWTKAVGGPLIDLAGNITVLPNDDLVILGALDSIGFGLTDVYLTKIDKNGILKWSRIYDGANTCSVIAIEQTSTGGFLLAGSTKNYSGGDFDIFIIKTDSLGNLDWAKTYGGSSDEGSSRIVKLGNSYIISFSTKSFGQGGYDIGLLRIDESGSVQSAKIYGTVTDESSASLSLTTQGDIAFTGHFGAITGTNTDGLLILADSTGNFMWCKKYGSTDIDAISAAQTYDNGFILAGSTQSFSAYPKGYLIKTDSVGNSGCYESNLTLIQQDITSILPVNIVFPNVFTDTSVMSINTATQETYGGLINSSLCFTSSVAVQDEKYYPFSLYPNPNNGTMSFEYELKNKEKGELDIFDITGRKIANYKLVTGRKIITVSETNLNNGIYFYTYKINDSVQQSEKIVIIK